MNFECVGWIYFALIGFTISLALIFALIKIPEDIWAKMILYACFWPVYLVMAICGINNRDNPNKK